MVGWLISNWNPLLSYFITDEKWNTDLHYPLGFPSENTVSYSF